MLVEQFFLKLTIFFNKLYVLYIRYLLLKKRIYLIRAFLRVREERWDRCTTWDRPLFSWRTRGSDESCRTSPRADTTPTRCPWSFWPSAGIWVRWSRSGTHTSVRSWCLSTVRRSGRGSSGKCRFSWSFGLRKCIPRRCRSGRRPAPSC